jgi:folate-binding protein YgfZ
MSAAVVDRSPRGLVVVSGDDATSFLQSLISQDLDHIEDGGSAPSLLLTPQGKLDVVFRVTRVGDEWWLDTDAEFGSRLAESLTRFRIRVKADIEDRTADTGMLSLIGAADSAAPEGLRALDGYESVDLIGPLGSVRTALAAYDSAFQRWTPAQFEVFRIEHGVPRLGIDIDEKTIPQEAFLDQSAVSFTKGCFLGQELVARIDSRGHVNRYLRRLQVDGDTVPPAGASVIAADKEVGSITSAAAVPGETRVVALGMVRREIDPPADVTVRWDGTEAPAKVLASETHA